MVSCVKMVFSKKKSRHYNIKTYMPYSTSQSDSRDNTKQQQCYNECDSIIGALANGQEKILCESDTIV